MLRLRYAILVSSVWFLAACGFWSSYEDTPAAIYQYNLVDSDLSEIREKISRKAKGLGFYCERFEGINFQGEFFINCARPDVYIHGLTIGKSDNFSLYFSRKKTSPIISDQNLRKVCDEFNDVLVNISGVNFSSFKFNVK